MSIEKAKAELQAVVSGPAGRHWNYGPAVSAVLEALEQAEQRIAELEKWVRGVEESMISASDRAEAAEKRVAELQARTLTVNLPDGYSVRSGHPINEGERGVMIPKEGGDWLHRFDVEHALQVAGVSLKKRG